MTDALDSMFYIFAKWVTYVFSDLSFTYGSYNVSFGWIIIAVSVMSMLIATILNIPSRLPSNAFYSSEGRFDRDVRRATYRNRVRKESK